MASVFFVPFQNLSTKQLYDILALRQKVFVVEQHCFYLDCDDLDELALHEVMIEDDKLIGYARLLPPGAVYETAAIGRVAVDSAHRGKEAGLALMHACIAKSKELYGDKITLSAQQQTVPFYERLGFKIVGETYMEAGILHIKMNL